MGQINELRMEIIRLIVAGLKCNNADAVVNYAMKVEEYVMSKQQAKEKSDDK